MFVGDTLYEINTADATAVCAALNSTWGQLLVNIEGRANFGAGVLEIEVYETANRAVVNPQLLPEPGAAVFNATDWDVLTPSAARRHIDAAVYEALGLTADEREAVHAGVAELVGNRKRRAGSVRGPASTTLPEQTAEKSEFRVVPHHGGFAPGVDPYQIKQILYEMDLEDYLRKNVL